MHSLAKKLGKYGTEPRLTFIPSPPSPKKKATEGQGAYLEALSSTQGLDNSRAWLIHTACSHWGSGSVMQLGSRHRGAACARHTCPRAIVPTPDHCPDTAARLNTRRTAISMWSAATNSLRILLPLVVALQTTEGIFF